ncbi:MAG: 3-hydroxyacyl-ACP dehydratase FabZ family protein [Capsulimonadaceae bacterium]
MTDTEAIREILEHRYPMLLVDRLEALTLRQSCVGIKLVSDTDTIGPGPDGCNIYPASLLIETMAQVGGIPMHRPDHAPAYIVKLEDFRFTGTVRSGDRLRVEGNLIWERARLFKVRLEASTEAGIVATGVMLYTIDEDGAGVV